MDKWNLIQDQPLLREIFKEPPLISYRKENCLKQNYKGCEQHNGHTAGVVQICRSHFPILIKNTSFTHESNVNLTTEIRSRLSNRLLRKYSRKFSDFSFGKRR